MDHKKGRRSVIIAALVLCLAAVTGFGTLAWLTAQDSLSNAFTVGNFNEPEHKPGEGEDDTEPGGETAGEGDHYLFETNWVAGSKLIPGEDVAKNPNLGIGADSDDAYVFLFVKNNTIANGEDVSGNAPFFTIESEWAPVNYESAWYGHYSTAPNATGKEFYEGLFMYATNDAGSVVPGILKSEKSTGSDQAASDVFTGELFQSVTAAQTEDTSVYSDDPSIDVYAYVYAVNYDDNDAPVQSGDGSAQAAIAAAVEWAKDQGLVPYNKA